MPPHPWTGPGSAPSFVVNADGRRYRWSVRRLGGAGALARGSSRAERSGAGPVEACRSRDADRARGDAPLHDPLCGAGTAAQRVLVVLPDATWQARNRLEGNGDGYPDLLPEDAEVSLFSVPTRTMPAAGIRRRPVGYAALPRSRAIPI